MGFGKIFGFVKIPLIVVILLAFFYHGFLFLFYSGLDFSSQENFVANNLVFFLILMFTPLIILLVYVSMLFLAGYFIGKGSGKWKQGIIGGIIVALGYGIVSSIMGFILYVPIITRLYELLGESNTFISTVYNGLSSTYQLENFIVSLIMALIVAGIIAAIGGYFGSKKYNKNTS